MFGKAKKKHYHINEKDRANLKEKALFLIKYANQIDYAEVRPFWTAQHGFDTWEKVKSHLEAGGRISMDCSESFSQLYHWCGLRCPSGPVYNKWEYGNTGTLYDYLKHYTAATHADVGAALIYKAPGGATEHVCMVLEPGSNPTLFSHGSEVGPLYISESNESAAHVGSDKVFLDCSRLGYNKHA